MNGPNDPGCTFLVRRQLRPAAGLDTVRRCLRSGWWGWAGWACPSARTWSVATAEALLLGRASGLDLGVLREVLADSAAGSDFICRDLDALLAGDFMRTFALDRCCEELQTVTELARDHHLPFQVSESVADLYRRSAVREQEDHRSTAGPAVGAAPAG